MDTFQRSRPADSGKTTEDGTLQVRIRAEFTEMPGLRLTLSQASRLFNLERSRCECVLGGLVREGDLASDGTSFHRRDDGRTAV